MSQYQAGTLVVYGNLSVHEIEAVGPQSFCGEPAREYYTLRPYFSDSHDRSYIPTAKEGVLRPVSTPEQAAACLEQVRSEPDAAPASANQTVLAEHYQAVIHTNDFYEYLKLYRELAHKQSTQRSKGRKVNAMDAYFYQMAERTLREELAVAFNDIDYCMKVRSLGKLVVYAPYALLYHYESKSRGLEDTPEKQLRFSKEVKCFRRKWDRELLKGDPYYSPNLSLKEGDCSLRKEERNGEYHA